YGEYRLVWTGAFPKVVPANSTPAITGGVGAGRWAYTSDAMIRQILTSIDGIVFIGSPEHTGSSRRLTLLKAQGCYVVAHIRKMTA
ncbi:hypothetical protein NL487_27800, partial [Klebsiella pneumoniae]|nr:hypothetical protein [Klebsiella pneumoniae]